MPTPPEKITSAEFFRAKERVLRVAREGGDWRTAARYNDVSYSTARRVILQDSAANRARGGVRPGTVKMTLDAMGKLEEYLDEDCRMTLQDMRDRLKSDLGVDVSRTTVHRALQGMLFSVKKIRIEKATMNNTINNAKRQEFATKIHAHMSRGDMIVYHDETNFNLYLSRSEGWSRVGERATVAFPPSQGDNLHVIGAVTSNDGLLFLRTHEGSLTKEINAQIIADIFLAATASDEYRDLEPRHKIVIVTDNAPAHSQVEELARQILVADGIVNHSKVVILRLAPYSPMLNPIEGCWIVLKARMRKFMTARKEEFLVRGEFSTYVEQRMHLMKSAFEDAKPAITRRLVLRLERHAIRAMCAAERNEDMQLGA